MIFFLLSLPFRLLRLAFKVGRLSTVATHRSMRLVGYRRLVVFGLGVAVGLLLAPVPGDKLRAKLRQTLEELAGGRAAATDLADKVREELAASPRTWHLPQPGVAAAEGRVTLSGEVPHATASADLERTARAVAGVTAVDNQLRIASN